MQVDDVDSDIALATDLDALVVWVSRNVPSSMSYAALRTLARLDREGPARVTELAEAEMLSQPGMTTLLNRLGDDGHVVREADPDDGRATRIRITEAGRSVLAERRADRAELISGLLSHLTEPQRLALSDALVALRPALGATPTPRKGALR